MKSVLCLLSAVFLFVCLFVCCANVGLFLLFVFVCCLVFVFVCVVALCVLFMLFVFVCCVVVVCVCVVFPASYWLCGVNRVLCVVCLLVVVC